MNNCDKNIFLNLFLFSEKRLSVRRTVLQNIQIFIEFYLCYINVLHVMLYFINIVNEIIFYLIFKMNEKIETTESIYIVYNKILIDMLYCFQWIIQITMMFNLFKYLSLFEILFLLLNIILMNRLFMLTNKF